MREVFCIEALEVLLLKLWQDYKPGAESRRHGDLLMRFSPALLFLAAALMVCAACAPKEKKEDPAAEKKKIESIVKEYIRSHPEELADSLNKYAADRRGKEQELKFKQSLTNRVSVPLEGSFSQGDENAPVTLVEFSDFECPFCARVNDTLKQIRNKYDGKLRVVFKNFPLVSIHHKAIEAARAAMAAGEQGKFWEYRNILLSRQGLWKVADSKPVFLKFAEGLGLDKDRFAKDMENKEYDKHVQDDMKLGQSLGVRATPTFFINGVMVQGAVGLDYFERVIDTLLSEKDAGDKNKKE